jgi:hypothetical protein
MKTQPSTLILIMIVLFSLLVSTGAWADDGQEFSLNDLMKIINEVNKDLPKKLDDGITLDRIVQGSGRQMIYIYDLSSKDVALSDKERKELRNNIQKSLCSSTEMFVKDGIAVSARMFTSDRRQVLGVTANKKTCKK